MIDSRDCQAWPADARPWRVGAIVVLCLSLGAATGCGHQGLIVQGDWSVGLNHVPWDENGGCVECGSTGNCRRGCRGRHRMAGRASSEPMREYEGIPNVPRFHPIPTGRVLVDPNMPSPTPAESLPAPPFGSDDNSGGETSDSLSTPAVDAAPPLPRDLDTGQHRPRPTQKQVARYRQSSRSPSRWAFRNAPPYYPRRR
jgi:hypothetical protein